jgi:hypothetical protein
MHAKLDSNYLNALPSSTVVILWQIRTLSLGRTTNDVGVGCDGSLHLRVSEVDDSVLLKDINLLDSGDGVHAEALESVLQALVVSGGGLVHRLMLSVGFKRRKHSLEG